MTEYYKYSFNIGHQQYLILRKEHHRFPKSKVIGLKVLKCTDDTWKVGAEILLYEETINQITEEEALLELL